MLGLSTGRYTVYRGVPSTNDYGDDVTDNSVASFTNVLGSVIERGRTNYDPQSGRVETVRQLTGRFRYDTDIEDGDRLVDEKTGEEFVVVSVFRTSGIAMKSDVVVDLMKN